MHQIKICYNYQEDSEKRATFNPHENIY